MNDLWIDRYRPRRTAELVGNKDGVKKLREWLSLWKGHMLLRRARKNGDTKQNGGGKKKKTMASGKDKGRAKNLNSDDDDRASEDSDMSDFINDADSSSDEGGTNVLCNTMFVTGPSGIGKSAAIAACAAELGFSMLDVNLGGHKSSKHVLSLIQEATQSHHMVRTIIAL